MTLINSVKGAGYFMKSKIYMIRHGLTEGNLRHFFYGGVDIPLTETGIEELKKLRDSGIYPKVPEGSPVFTSGMIRTKQTLETIYGSRPSQPITDLREYNFGRFEMKTYDELKDEEEVQAWFNDKTGDLPICPEGDSRNGFYKRVERGTRYLLKQHHENILAAERGQSPLADFGGPVTLLVCHGGVISQMIQQIFETGGTMWDYVPDPGKGFILTFDGMKPVSFEKIGDTRLPIEGGDLV